MLKDINNLHPDDVPDCDGVIGGPPCQLWSIAGQQKGLEDKRGILFNKLVCKISFTYYYSID